jgi:hypothetical protein
VSSSDYQRAVTDKVTEGAVDFGLALRVIGDPTAVLQVARKSKENDALDLSLKGRWECLDGAIHDCGALARGSQMIRIAIPQF